MSNNVLAVTSIQAVPLINDVLNAGLTPSLTGSPGCGKSDIIKNIAKERNLKVIDVRLSQCDSTDLSGFPMVNKETGKTSYLPMDTFPTEDDAVPDGYSGWLIFLDEFNSAPLSVQAASYKLVLDRMVGLHNLHEKVEIVTAGNLASDKAIVNRVSTAMQSRMVHLELMLSNKAWMDWADSADIDFRIKSFINFKPEALHQFDPDHNDKTFACPRTWEFLSRIIKPMATLDNTKLPLLAGTISVGMGREFLGFSKIFQSLPSIKDIVAAPDKTAVPTEPSVNFAVSGMIGAHMDASNVDKLVEYTNRLGKEFQIITLRSALKRNPALIANKAVDAWIEENSQELLD